MQSVRHDVAESAPEFTPAEPAEPPIEVAAAVIAADGRYLLAQRRLDQEFPLCWEFPGGKREPGEAWDACLARELREELGVGVRVGGLVDAVTHEYPNRRVTLRFYRCEVVDGTPRPIACRDVRWVSAGDLPMYEFPAADVPLVAWLGRFGAAGPARVCFQASGRSVAVPAGTLLEEASARAGACLPFGCRVGTCGACRVVVRAGAGKLSRPTRAERAALAEMGAAPGERLACLARALGDVVIDSVGADHPLA
jgi:8-oxo-dGTP diphosphatase